MFFFIEQAKYQNSSHNRLYYPTYKIKKHLHRYHRKETPPHHKKGTTTQTHTTQNPKNQNKKKQKDNSRELSFLFLHHIRHHRFYVENINQHLNVTLKLNFTFTQYEREFLFNTKKISNFYFSKLEGYMHCFRC